jgi:hypothetical protein
LNYESARRHLPPSANVDLSLTSTPNNLPWGIHGRILPYLEEKNLHDRIDFNVAWDANPSISGARIAVFQCPSDLEGKRIRDPGGGKPLLFATNYGFNMGTWFVFDPRRNLGGDGPFYPNSNLRMAQVRDGTSKTLMCAEVKAWQPYARNGGPSTTAIPNTPIDAATAVASGSEFKDTGHTEWPDGRVHHTGITATMAPNTVVPYLHNGLKLDADFNSWQEGKNGQLGNPTYAIVTSRSFHAGQIQATWMDGSVQAVPDGIDLQVWRALATRSGGEPTQSTGPP